MKILQSAENYLETILILKKRQSEVRAVDIAKHLNFSKPSVSTALKQLRTQELITINASGFISLTQKGMDLATAIYEKHNLITQFFIRLDVPEITASKDACRIEHLISDITFEKLKAYYATTFLSKET